MTDPSLRDRAVQLYDAFTHEHRDRRTLLRQMTALAGSAVAAEEALRAAGVDPKARGEQLSVEQFAAVASARTRVSS